MLKFLSALRAFVLLVVICCCGSCSRNVPTPNMCQVPDRVKFPSVKRKVFVDPKFTPRAMTDIHSTMAEWTQRTRGIVQWEMPTTPPAARDLGENSGSECSDSIVVTAALSTSALVQKVEELKKGGEILAFTYTTCKFNFMLIVIDRIGSEAAFKSTVLHEFGHYLGLKHVDDKSALMYPDNSAGASCVTKADLKQFCEIWSCNATLLDPCQ